MRRLALVTTALLSTSLARSALADDYFVVTDLTVGHNGALAVDDVREVFLGQKLFLSDNRRVVGLLSGVSGGAASHFLAEVLGMHQDQYAAYWRRKLFAGKGHPPKELTSDDQALQYIQSNHNCIAIISQVPPHSELKGLEVLRVDRAQSMLVPVASSK